MNVLQVKSALGFLILWTFLWALLGIVACWGWALWRLATGRGLFPDRPLVERERPPWRSGTVLLVLLAYLLVGLFIGTGYGWATRDRRPGPPRDGRAAPEAVPHHKDHKLSPLEGMSLQSALNALFIVLAPGIVWLTSGATPRHLGWSRRDLGRQAMVGVVAVLMLMPIVYGIQKLAMDWLGPFGEESEHPVQKMLNKGFSPNAAIMAVLGGVVLAPICEEILFRGILQTWLVQFLTRATRNQPEDDIFVLDDPLPSPGATSSDAAAFDATASDAAASDAAVLDAAASDAAVLDAAPSETLSLNADFPEVGPAEKIEAMPKPSDPSERSSTTATGTAIVLTSLIFAALHAGQWPAPIAIFVLALGLGQVYQRTGSLFSSICMHAVFNGLSTLALFYQLLAPPPVHRPGAVPPPAVKRAAPAKDDDEAPAPPHALKLPLGASRPAN